MSIKEYLHDKKLNKKSSGDDTYNRQLKLLSPINHPKYTLNKIYIDCNTPKGNTKSNYKKPFKNLKIPIKKSLSIDNRHKPYSHKILNKYHPAEKILINCLNEKQAKEENDNKNNEKHEKTSKLQFLQNNWRKKSTDDSPVVNMKKNNNLFNTQYKRTESHSNSTKIPENNGFINIIKKKINELSNPSKFYSSKKENEPTKLLNDSNKENANKIMTFTSLALNNQKSNKLNLIDFDNSKSDNSHSSNEEHHNNNREDNIKIENNSNNVSFENDIDEKKLIIKSEFKINKNEEDEKDEKKEKDEKEEKSVKDEKEEKSVKDENNNILKLNDDNKDNEINNINSVVVRKQRYGYTVQENQIPLLNKKFLLSSVITKPGMCDQEEKTNQDSYLIKENIFGEDFNIYGVFDGHGDNGDLISNYISEFLNNYYTNESNYIDNKDISTSEINKLNKIFLENNETIIKNCQKNLDSNLNTKINFDISQSGSTCVLLFVVSETLICSNIGDSQCYLFNCSEEEMWTFELLSKIHKPTDDEERDRILNNGGEIHPYYDENGIFEGPDRVYAKNKPYPGLCLSRSIGDLEGKKIGVISDPDIIIKKIDNNSKYVVLASDGLWDVIKPYDVIRMVRPYFKKGDSDGACKLLLKKAEQMWKKHNEERDDITIIIVFIGKPKIQNEKNNLLSMVKENVNEENSNSNKKESKNKVPLLLNLD